MSKTGIEREVAIGFNGAIILAFVCSVVWACVVAITAIDGTMMFVGAVGSAGEVVKMAAFQSAVVFSGVLLVWYGWNGILFLASLLTLFSN